MSPLSIHRLKKLAAVPLNPSLAGIITAALFRGEFKAARGMASQTPDLGAEKIVFPKVSLPLALQPQSGIPQHHRRPT